MPTLDIFNEDAFSLQSLTGTVNERPYTPGQVSALGVFEEDSVTTLTVSIEHMDGQLALVEPTERGGPGETIGDEDRKLIPFRVPHYQRDDTVMADEVQGIRAFGTESETDQVMSRVTAKTDKHTRHLDMTLEHQRVGALKGVVTSKSGKVLHDLYSTFEIAAPNAVSLELDVDATDVGEVFGGVVHSMEDDLDEVYSGIHVMAGRDLHNKLWRHKSVKETLMYHSGAVAMRNDVPDVFELFGATWERYRTGKKASNDLGAPYIAHDEGRVFFKGVPDLFITRFAPADYMETVNTPGLPRYAKQVPMLNGKGVDVEVQMNAISLCTRPKTLRRVTVT
ncbi:MAG: major capsid protein [Pseudomonadota bacterium]